MCPDLLCFGSRIQCALKRVISKRRASRQDIVLNAIEEGAFEMEAMGY